MQINNDFSTIQQLIKDEIKSVRDDIQGIRDELKDTEKRLSDKIDNLQKTVDIVQNVMVKHYGKLDQRMTDIEDALPISKNN